MVPRPKRYSPKNRLMCRNHPEDNASFDRTLSYMATLKTAISSIETIPRLGYIKKLYIAICHRITCNMILWNDAIKNDKSNDVGDSPRIVEGLCMRIAHSSFNDFDALKCPDTITIISSNSNIGCTALQRASKVWGTILSSQCYQPKSGTHYWAVRLDQCEKGHIFVGIATSSASMKTYVGGDRHGWGLIGTRTLWHDRRKIRTDYGNAFRSGLIIVVTLDTDVGNIRFGVWDKLIGSDLESPDSYSDWGIAFEGLPLDSEFYPAVRL